MVEIGYAVMCEEHAPGDLVRYTRRAEEAGFGFAFVSDHFLPWVPRQGNAPFAWTLIGALSQVTERIRIGTGVTCPTVRYHPAVVAQAAATCAVMLPGRFMLGLGSGELLNEHVVGAHWPAPDVRHAMLEEAIEAIRALFSGEQVTYRGRHVTVEEARLYTLPDEPPPIVVAASGEQAAQLAGRLGDGLVGLAPSGDLLETFRSAAGGDAPRYGQVTVCWAASEDQAVETALEWWPQTALQGDENTELRTPEQFAASAAIVKPDDVRAKVACGPDPAVHLDLIGKYVDAGYDHVYLHQIGPDQDGFFDFAERELLPAVAAL